MVLDGVVDPTEGLIGLPPGQTDGFDRRVRGRRSTRAFGGRGRVPRGRPGRRLRPGDGARSRRTAARPAAAGRPGGAGDGRHLRRVRPSLWPTLGACARPRRSTDDGTDAPGPGRAATTTSATGPPTPPSPASTRRHPAAPTAYQAFADQACGPSSPRFGGSVGNELLPCATWPVPQHRRHRPRHRRRAHRPSLVVGNTGDAATPYDDSVEVADDLTSGHLVTYDGEGTRATAATAASTDVDPPLPHRPGCPGPDTRCGAERRSPCPTTIRPSRQIPGGYGGVQPRSGARSRSSPPCPIVTRAVHLPRPTRHLTYREFGGRSPTAGQRAPSPGSGRTSTERSELGRHESGQDHLALYLHNGNEYLEAMLGAYKARVAPVQRQLPLRRRGARLPARRLPGPGHRLPLRASPRPRRRSATDFPDLQVLLQVADDSGNALLDGAEWYEDALAAQPDDARPDESWRRGRPTTSTSSTPAGPPACRRACCGARPTSSWRRSAVGGWTTGEEWESVDEIVAERRRTAGPG